MFGRVLIVDDEPNQRRSLAIGLRLEGFDVHEAEDGEHALRKLQGMHVDLAIIDLMMPGLNGLDLARRVRFRYPDVSIVLTSAYHLTENQLLLYALKLRKAGWTDMGKWESMSSMHPEVYRDF